MDYSKMVEDALKGVVRAAMQKASTDGLHGNHHFYVTFLTRAPGVELPDHLLNRYPTDITIVLQHQYWDMEVTQDQFAVSLSFNKLPTRIVVPFDAITSFADPSVQFGLQFQSALDSMNEGAGVETSAPEPLAFLAEPDNQSEPGGERPDDVRPDGADAEQGGDDQGEEAEPRGEVVSLDAFRRKP